MPSHARRLAAALLLALTTSAAFAAPDIDPIGSDALGRFLADSGIANAAKNASTVANAPVAAASDMVVTAMNFLGVRYRRGGNDADGGFDCSGFTRYVFENSVGLVLPRRADEQAKAPGLVPVKRDELKPGDLVFFNTLKRTFSHVGIYVGDGKFIHSPRPGGEVRVEDMGFKYWKKRFTGARRVEPANPPAMPQPVAAEPAAGPAAGK
ncbi:MAG TPA: C40 family peptidase [Burkholderiaceae bacterium]|nr:C40 family peptidase [Burkholderiaceae bacterium]